MRNLFYIFLLVSASAFSQNAYISRVFEYRPAPGQFVNMAPYYEPGDTDASMAQKAEDAIANNALGMISLGSFGGYVVFGFDHEVQNLSGHYDFSVLGNAFYDSAFPDVEGGSSEPGIVLVSHDDNANGLPDDEWYELAGSEYYKATTLHDYSLTYYRTPADHVPVRVKGTPIIDSTYIAWQGSDDVSGYVLMNSYHRQDYFPMWISDDELTFTGTLLPPNAIDMSSNGSHYLLQCYGYGYADNHPNADSRSKFNIDWAVDASGSHVHLSGIHFVKVYTAVLQCFGSIGETSTELMGASDLHLLGGDDADVYYTPSSLPQHIINANAPVYNLLGQRVTPGYRGIVIRNGKKYLNK